MDVYFSWCVDGESDFVAADLADGDLYVSTVLERHYDGLSYASAEYEHCYFPVMVGLPRPLTALDLQ